MHQLHAPEHPGDLLLLTAALLRAAWAMNRRVYVPREVGKRIGRRIDGGPHIGADLRDRDVQLVNAPEPDALHLAAIGDGRWEVRSFDPPRGAETELGPFPAAMLEAILDGVVWGRIQAEDVADAGALDVPEASDDGRPRLRLIAGGRGGPPDAVSWQLS